MSKQVKGLKNPFTCFPLWQKRDGSLKTEYPFTKYILFVAVISISVCSGTP